MSDEGSGARSYCFALEQALLVADIVPQLDSVGEKNPEDPAEDEPLHLGRSRHQVVVYATFKALVEPWQAEMSLTKVLALMLA